MKIILFLFLMLILPTTLYANNVQEGINEGSKGNYRKSYKILMPLAREGNAQAQSAVGYMLSKGLGVKRNRESAVYWYKQSASQGNTTAQFNLGMAYVKGRGVRRNLIYAYMWWDIAASLGHKRALKNMNEVSRDLSGSEIRNAQKLARECVRKKYKGC